VAATANAKPIFVTSLRVRSWPGIYSWKRPVQRSNELSDCERRRL